MNNLREFVDKVATDGGAIYSLVTGTSPTEGIGTSLIDDKEKLVGKSGSVTQELFISAMVSHFIAKNGFELNNPENYLSAWKDDKYLHLTVCRVDDAKNE